MGQQSLYRLIYRDTGQVVANRVRKASGFWDKGVGLIGVRELAEGEGLWLPGVASVHTFGMRFPIDILFFDRNFLLKGSRIQVAPNRLVLAPSGTRSCVELPGGSVPATLTGECLGQWLILV